jgi:hypothetical protein
VNIRNQRRGRGVYVIIYPWCVESEVESVGHDLVDLRVAMLYACCHSRLCVVSRSHELDRRAAGGTNWSYVNCANVVGGRRTKTPDDLSKDMVGILSHFHSLLLR